MAVYVPVRPRWNPRGVVVNYVSRGRLLVRGWPRGYRDANTAEQRRQRGKMARVCEVLPYLKSLLMEGYAPLVKRNGRRVSGYHVAVGAALREWFVSTPQGDELDHARIRLTDGVRGLPAGLAFGREGGTLRLAWAAPLPWSGAKLLLAVRQKGLGQWVGVVQELCDGVAVVDVELPEAWKGKEVEVWVAFVGDGGRVKTATRHASLPAAVPPGGGTATGSGEPMKVGCPPLAAKGGKVRRGGRRRTARLTREGACRFGLPHCRCEPC